MQKEKRMRHVGPLVVTMALAALLPGCGGGGGGAPDAFVFPPTPDAAPPDAAPPDAAPPDAPPRGDVQNFDECGSSCTCTDDPSCADPTSRCTLVDFIDPPRTFCLPACTPATQDAVCPFNSVCYQPGVGMPMHNKCYYSLCGPLFNNGATGGPCTLGADSESQAAAGEQYPGYCLSFADDSYGLCLEAGTQTAGDPCDLSVQTRTGMNCDQSSICIGGVGSATGTCAAVCDPRDINLSTSAGDTCPSGSGCLDASTHSSTTGGPAIGTLGYCLSGEVACSLVADTNICPNTAGGQMQGCAPTNSVRPTGLCDPNWGGTLALGALCSPTATTDSGQCPFGSDCMNNTGVQRCEKFCDVAAIEVNCGTEATGTCQTFDLGGGDITLQWGTCRP